MKVGSEGPAQAHTLKAGRLQGQQCSGLQATQHRAGAQSIRSSLSPGCGPSWGFCSLNYEERITDTEAPTLWAPENYMDNMH